MRDRTSLALTVVLAVTVTAFTVAMCTNAADAHEESMWLGLVCSCVGLWLIGRT